MATKRGRVAKTLVVPVRMDPILKWAAELAAGKERRSLNSFVEWAVEQAVKRVDVGYRMDEKTSISAWDIANECWHFSPLYRVYMLWRRSPDILTVKEQSIIEALSMFNLDGIEEHKYFRELMTDTNLWEAFERFGEEELSLEELTGRFTDAEAKIEARHGKQAPNPS